MGLLGVAPWAMLGGEEDSRVGGVGLGDSILGGGANLGNGVMENIGVNPLRNSYCGVKFCLCHPFLLCIVEKAELPR